MVSDVQKGLTISHVSSTIVLIGVIRVASGVFCRFGCVATEVSSALRADDGGECFWLYIWKRVNNDIFDPVSMVTRTAAVFVPLAGIRIEFQKLVHDWVGHILAPVLFLHII